MDDLSDRIAVMQLHRFVGFQKAYRSMARDVMKFVKDDDLKQLEKADEKLTRIIDFYDSLPDFVFDPCNRFYEPLGDARERLGQMQNQLANISKNKGLEGAFRVNVELVSGFEMGYMTNVYLKENFSRLKQNELLH